MRSCGAISFVTALFLFAPPFGGESEAQKEVAIVQHKVDLNGDGKVDELRIDDLGIISVLITGSEDDGAWTPLAANGKIVGGSFRVDSQVDPSGRPLILAVAKLRRSKNQTYEEALVLSYSPGKLTTLWRGPQGSDEADGALRRFVELGDHGLIRYASRHGVFRCDGKTAHLDAKRYDFASNSFRPVKQAIRIPAGAPRLQALSANPATIPQDSRGFWFRPRGASSSLRATSPSQLVAPLAISDRNSKTAWVENKPGLGSGEFVTMQSGLGAVHIKALRFELGHGGAAKGFRSPKKIGLLIGKEKAFWIDFPNMSSGTPLWVELPEPISASCVTVVLADSLTKNSGRGRGRGRTVGTTRTAISEISVLSSEELDTRRSSELLAEGIAAGRAKADTRRLLKNLGNKASSALLSVLKKTTNRRAQTRLRLALATIPAAPEELVLGLLDDSLGAKDYMHFGRALRKIGPASVPALAAALARPGRKREGGKRVALMLQTMPGQEAKDALLNALGRGSNAQRKAVLRALGASPGAWPMLRQALDREQPVAVKADLFRAAAVAAESFELGSTERAEIGQTIAEALSAPKLAYELRYRLLQVAGNVGGAQATGALIGQYEAFEKLGAAGDVSSQALMEVAAAALAQSESSASNATIGLGSSLPGVRLASVQNTPSDKVDVIKLSAILRSDKWPEIRRSTAALLGSDCTGSLRFPALNQAVSEDSDTTVAKTALHALQRCHRPGLFRLLLAIVDSPSRPLSLRLYAARELASTTSADPSEIVARFRNAKARALSDKASAKLAAALTVSLGDLKTPEAITALEKSAADPAFPQLQAAALSALSESCPRSSRKLFRTLQKSYDHSVSRAATAAYRRCR